MVASGYSQSVSFGNETSYGSAATVDQPFGLVQSVDPTESNSLIKVRNLGGTRDYGAIVPGKFEVGGTLEYYLQGAAFLRQAIGEDTATTTTIDSGPRIFYGTSSPKAYLHVMGSAQSPGVNNFPSFTMEFADEENAAVNPANLLRTYTGCRVDNLTISGNVDEPVKVNVDWKAAEVIASTGPATDITAYTVDPYVFYQGCIYFTSATIDSDTVIGTTDLVANINSFEVAVANNLEVGWYVGGTTNSHQSKRGAKHIIPKGRDYTVKLGVHFDNASMYRKFLGSATATMSETTLTKYTCVMDLVRTGVIGTRYGTADYVRMVFASATFDDINITGAPEDLVSEDLTLFVKNGKIYVADNDASYL